MSLELLFIPYRFLNIRRLASKVAEQTLITEEEMSRHNFIHQTESRAMLRKELFESALTNGMAVLFGFGGVGKSFLFNHTDPDEDQGIGTTHFVWVNLISHPRGDYQSEEGLSEVKSHLYEESGGDSTAMPSWEDLRMQLGSRVLVLDELQDDLSPAGPGISLLEALQNNRIPFILMLRPLRHVEKNVERWHQDASGKTPFQIFRLTGMSEQDLRVTVLRQGWALVVDDAGMAIFKDLTGGFGGHIFSIASEIRNAAAALDNPFFSEVLTQHEENLMEKLLRYESSRGGEFIDAMTRMVSPLASPVLLSVIVAWPSEQQEWVRYLSRYGLLERVHNGAAFQLRGKALRQYFANRAQRAA